MKRKQTTQTNFGVVSRIDWWLKRVQELIVRHSSAPLKTGPSAGHAVTDTMAWVVELAQEVQDDISLRKGKSAYDENMALAADLGMILSVWYATTHRAKSYDLNRPLDLRQKANFDVSTYKANMALFMHDDQLMAEVFPNQPYNFPFGLGAAGGKYV